MNKDARRARRLPAEDQKRNADEYRRLGMPALARDALSPRDRNGRPEWQKRILRLVSPAWRAKERRVAEFARLVAMAERAHERDEGGPLVVDVETGQLRPPTEDEQAEAYRLIHEHLEGLSGE